MIKSEEFAQKVSEILKWEGMIGSTEEQIIRWKTHEIMRLAEMKVDLTKE